MKHIKNFALTLTLVLAFAGSSFAGETATPPCPQPVPGETATPPCDGGSNVVSDPTETTFSEAISAAVDDLANDAIVKVADSVFMIF